MGAPTAPRREEKLMRTQRWHLSLFLAAALAATSACGDDDNDAAETGDGDSGDGDSGDGDSGQQGAKNIVETAVANGNFTKLAEALVATNLDDTLSGAGPFTVFAPTDAAFAALGEETLSSLSNEELAAILKYHV